MVAVIPAFSQRTLDKARTTEVEPDDTHPRLVAWVRSSSGDTSYRVQMIRDDLGQVSWVTCTCPHGLHKGGGQSVCYHAAATLMSYGDMSDTGV